MKRHLFDILILVLLLAFALSTFALSTFAGESEYEAAHRMAGKYGITNPREEIDVRLPSGIEVDYLPSSSVYAYEIDRASKFTEAIGQSLEYALETNRKPAIILLVNGTEKDQWYFGRCRKVCERYGIALFQEPLED